MIKLSNQQASRLVSYEAKKMIQKDFPTKVSFAILDLLQMIEQRIKPYYSKYHEIVKKYGGEFQKTGLLIFQDEQSQSKASIELTELNNVILQYNFDPIEITDDWPKLSISEAAILKPLINGNDDAEHIK